MDRAYQITDAEALPMMFELMEKEGLYLGGSSAINVAGAYHMAKDMGPGHVICTILCDSGQRYQSKIWNPAFLREKNLPVPDWLEYLRRDVMQTTIVTADWLLARPNADILIFDASYFLPTMGQDGCSEYDKAHIPGLCSLILTALRMRHLICRI